ncbi:MAG: hypothetical protein ACK4ME_01360 [Fimbriimonadales bacterium]
MQRPVSVTVIASLGVVGGLFLVASALFTAVFVADPAGVYGWLSEKPYYKAQEYDKQLMDILTTDPITRIATGIQGAFFGVLGLLLLIGSRKLLRLEEQGRRLVLGFALVWLIFEGASLVADQLYYAPMRAALGIPPSQGYGVPLDIVYALVVLYVLTRPAIKGAMHRVAAVQ